MLGGRPLLCMAFDNMRMEVNEPEVVRDTVEGGRTAQRAVALAAVAADRLV